jgi:hypothetical protein
VALSSTRSRMMYKICQLFLEAMYMAIASSWPYRLLQQTTTKGLAGDLTRTQNQTNKLGSQWKNLVRTVSLAVERLVYTQ